MLWPLLILSTVWNEGRPGTNLYFSPWHGKCNTITPCTHDIKFIQSWGKLILSEAIKITLEQDSSLQVFIWDGMFLAYKENEWKESWGHINNMLTCTRHPTDTEQLLAGDSRGGILSRSAATWASLVAQMDCISAKYSRGSWRSCSLPALLWAWCFATASKASFLRQSISAENLYRSN